MMPPSPVNYGSFDDSEDQPKPLAYVNNYEPDHYPDSNHCTSCEDSPMKPTRSKTTDYGDSSYRPKLDFWEEVRGWGSILTGIILILIVAAGMVANDRSYAECLQRNPTNAIEMCE